MPTMVTTTAILSLPVEVLAILTAIELISTNQNLTIFPHG